MTDSTPTPEPTDPLVTKLMELFGQAELPQDEIGIIGTGGVVPLAGMPIQDAAEMVRSYYLQAVSTEIATVQADTGSYGPWDPAHWVIVAPSYLFPAEWTTIDGVALLKNDLDPMPDWTAFMVRSSAWWTQQLTQHQQDMLRDRGSQFMVDAFADRIARARRSSFVVIKNSGDVC